MVLSFLETHSSQNWSHCKLNEFYIETKIGFFEQPDLTVGGQSNSLEPSLNRLNPGLI
jgi:hypothetical protein